MDLYNIVEQLYAELFGEQNQKCELQTILNQYSKHYMQNQTNILYKINDSRKDTNQNRFRWTKDLHRRFCIICTSLHWKVCTPKHIHRFLPNVPVSVIASHLQKTRIGILNEVDIEYWKENNHRLTDEEIQLILD
ncbi:Conserved_hypothetical protein [Hexamita inflata]|uniref:Uncharacterized protein n=1 Tax=Hexamita inflata TaxID=28002 RepID=A0ABP1HRZ3_9EUKA